MKYYVYHAYGISNELLYVGKGSGDYLRRLRIWSDLKEIKNLLHCEILLLHPMIKYCRMYL